MVIGLALSNETVENAFFMACHLVHRCKPPPHSYPTSLIKIDGYCLRHPAEQQGSLKFLAHVEKRVGWRTAWMVEELEQQWQELSTMDSW